MSAASSSTTWTHDFDHEPSLAELTALEDIQAAGWFQQEETEPVRTTLLELVEAVTDVSRNESEVIGTVAYMLSSGSVELTGSFRNEPISKFLASR